MAPAGLERREPIPKQAYACPMVSGTGIKNKLLEALSCGAPCIATSLACQGLGITTGKELLGAAARSRVTAHHSWSGVAASYERLYEEAVAAA